MPGRKNGWKLGNGERGCVAYIYTLSNDPTHFPAIPPGGGWLKRKPFGTGLYFNQPGELLLRQGSTTSTTIANSIYTPIVHDWNTPIAITLEMFGLSRLHIQTPNISEKTNATKILFCGVRYFPAFLPRGSSPPNWILIFVGLAVPTSLSV